MKAGPQFRRAAQLSEHRALPIARPLGIRAPLPAPFVRFSSRETIAPFAWNIRDWRSYSVRFVALENSHLVRNLVRFVFAFLAAINENAAKWRRINRLIWRGRRGSNPRPPA